MTIFINYRENWANVELHNNGKGMGIIEFRKKDNTTPLKLAENYATKLKKVIGGENVYIKKGYTDNLHLEQVGGQKEIEEIAVYQKGKKYLWEKLKQMILKSNFNYKELLQIWMHNRDKDIKVPTESDKLKKDILEWSWIGNTQEDIQELIDYVKKVKIK